MTQNETKNKTKRNGDRHKRHRPPPKKSPRRPPLAKKKSTRRSQSRTKIATPTASAKPAETRKSEVWLKLKFRSWRWILSKNRQNRSYPQGVNVRWKFTTIRQIFLQSSPKCQYLRLVFRRYLFRPSINTGRHFLAASIARSSAEVFPLIRAHLVAQL